MQVLEMLLLMNKQETYYNYNKLELENGKENVKLKGTKNTLNNLM
jgi:hypothetical protein